jgi:hypothetical protein
MTAKGLVGLDRRKGVWLGWHGELPMGRVRTTVGARGVAGAGRGLEDRVGRVVVVVFLQLSGQENGIAAVVANQRRGDSRHRPARGMAEPTSKGVRGGLLKKKGFSEFDLIVLHYIEKKSN